MFCLPLSVVVVIKTNVLCDLWSKGHFGELWLKAEPPSLTRLACCLFPPLMQVHGCLLLLQKVLDPSQFQVAIKWWLGLDLSYGSCCPLCPEIALGPLGHHAVTCKRGGDVVSRHNKLRDVLAESCRRAHLGVQVEMGNNLTNHSHTRPADLLVPNWVLGKPAAFDLSVTSPLNPTTLSEASVTTGVAALTTELRRHSSNDTKCKELDWVCVPLVMESYGAWGKEALESIFQLASRLATCSSKASQWFLLNSMGG